MQAGLDTYLVGYNTKRPHQGRGMNGRTPAKAFREGIHRHSRKEDKTELNPPPDSLSRRRLLSGDIISLQIGDNGVGSPPIDGPIEALEPDTQ